MDEGQIMAGLDLGGARATLEGKKGSPLEMFLEASIQSVIDQLRNKLDSYDASASGRLQQDLIPTEPVEKNGMLTVGIDVQDAFYWKFVNYGVNGTLVNRGAPSWGAVTSQAESMSQALRGWEGDRGITYVNGHSSWTSKSHVEGMGLVERGQIARPFFTDVVNKTLADSLAGPISKLLGKAIKIKIIEPWQ
tara:strand:+ start:720 stop:1295 length:576 start_codon:yes stop_codon:yes gene_type:complete